MFSADTAVCQLQLHLGCVDQKSALRTANQCSKNRRTPCSCAPRIKPEKSRILIRNAYRTLTHVTYTHERFTGLSPHNHGFILVRGRGLPGWSMTQLEASGHGWTYCSYCPIPAGSDFRTQRAARRRPPGKYRHLQWRLYEGSTDRLCIIKPYR